MFKLVGKETFNVGKSETKATINIDAVSGFAYEYTLEIDGKSLKKYMENRSKVTSTWVLNLDGIDSRVVLGELRCLCVPSHLHPSSSISVCFHLFVHTINRVGYWIAVCYSVAIYPIISCRGEGGQRLSSQRL